MTETIQNGAPLLSVEGLVRHFDVSAPFLNRLFERLDRAYVKAVDGIGFEVGRGETFSLVGESGCGKSVTALSLAALAASPPLQISSGTEELDGKDILRLALRLLQDIRGKRFSYIFQDPLATLNPVLTIGEKLIQVIRRH